MRIFSKQHDYYDGVAKSWRGDPKRVFNRKEEDIFIDSSSTNFVRALDSNLIPHWQYGTKGKYIDFGLVGFCGKIYPYAEIEKNIWSGIFNFAYSYEEVKNHLYSRRDYDKKAEPYIQKKVKAFFEADFSSFEKIFKEYNCAYFSLKFASRYCAENRSSQFEWIITKYPILTHYDFPKVKDAFQCWQKIEQYLTNDLVPPDMVEHDVPDEIKAQSHGFNKFSFRREKQ